MNMIKDIEFITNEIHLEEGDFLYDGDDYNDGED